MTTNDAAQMIMGFVSRGNGTTVVSTESKRCVRYRALKQLVNEGKITIVKELTNSLNTYVVEECNGR